MAEAREDALVRGLLKGVAAFRWLAWAWMAVVLVVTRDELDGGRPWIAVLLAAVALVVTAVTAVAAQVDPDRLLSTPLIVLELAVGFALGAGDDWAYAGPHPQSLGSVWPLAGVLTAGILWAGRGGAVAGAVVGLGRLFGDLVEVRTTEPIRDLTISATSTAVLYALAGGMAGYVVVKLREAERQISVAQAREEVARTLHDGVLQTLAVVQRRTRDDRPGPPGPGAGARAARVPLRRRPPPAASWALACGTRRPASRTASAAGPRWSWPTTCPPHRPDVVEALAGAVGEALTNAGKHGGATSVTVYAEPDGDGRVLLGEGRRPRLRRSSSRGSASPASIRGRIEEVGGRVEIDGRPGRGAEVRLWA